MLNIGKLNIKNKSQLSRTMFLSKYGSMYLYDEDLEKRFIIDHEQLKFDRNYGWKLFGICNKPDGTLSDHETFCINGDLFDRIKSTRQDKISFGIFYKMNQIKTNLRLKQQRDAVTTPKRRRELLKKITEA